MINVDVVNESVELVHGSRSQDYDGNKTAMELVADLWSAYLDIKITTADANQMMMLLKIARNKHNYKRDNYVDAIGYALLAEAAHREQE